MGTSAEDKALTMVVVRATRNISPDEEVLVSYTGGNSAKNLWFECTCCSCAGKCRVLVQARNNTKQQNRMKMDVSQPDSGRAKQSSINKKENTVETSSIQEWLRQTHRQRPHSALVPQHPGKDAPRYVAES